MNQPIRGFLRPLKLRENCWMPNWRGSHLGISKMMVIRSPMTLGHKETSGDPLASNSHVHFRAARHIHWNWIGEPCYGGALNSTCENLC